MFGEHVFSGPQPMIGIHSLGRVCARFVCLRTRVVCVCACVVELDRIIA